MPERKFMLRPGERVPEIGELWEEPNSGLKGRVTAAVPGQLDIIVDFDVDPTAVARAMDASPVVVDSRPPHEYRPLWLPPTPEARWSTQWHVGDTRELHGFTPAVQELARWGQGVRTLLFDSGLWKTHEAFRDKDIYGWSENGRHFEDEHGHGTFTGGQFFGQGRWGLASDGTAASFLVLPGPEGIGSESLIVRGVRAAGDWLARMGGPAVANASLGGPHSSLIAGAFQWLAETYDCWCSCAAGNDGPQAAVGSPADAPGMVVVGCITRELAVADFSSGGDTDRTLTVYAIGHQIRGASRGTDAGEMEASGTSMSAPEVAAFLAYARACGLTKPQAVAYLNSHGKPLHPPARNGRPGLFVRADLQAGNGLTPPPSTGVRAQLEAAIQQVSDVGTEYDRAGQALDQALAAPALDAARPLLEQAREHIQAAAPQRTAALDALWAVAGQLPKADGPPPPPPPPPGGGFRQRVQYGEGPREWANLSVPRGATHAVGLVLIHGGGWLQGDPDAAIPLEQQTALRARWAGAGWPFAGPDSGVGPEDASVREVTTTFARWGWVVFEPAYPYSQGNPDLCLASIKKAIAWLIAHADENGLDPAHLVFAGHSAGGQLAVRAALDPAVARPRAVVTLAGAGLYITEQTRLPSPLTQMIFDRAWGPRAHWPRYSPHTHLNDRPERLRLVVVQGGRDDQLDPEWARLFVEAAQAAGHDARLDFQPTGDHFSVARVDTNPQTAQDFRIAVG